ncbi:large ribosomal subunit protein mL38-like [Glandiceps talaboti]
MAAPLACIARAWTGSLVRGCTSNNFIISNYKTSLQSVRHRCVGASAGIDIGLPKVKPSRTRERRERKVYLAEKKKDPKLEQAARLQTLKIPLDEVKTDWEKTVGPYQIRSVAQHYNVFKDLFDSADFLPQVIMHINYDQTDDFTVPVHRGNVVSPAEATNTPSISYSSSPDDLWTLLLTNPDGHLLDNEAEYLHWMVGNIPGNEIEKGELICDYLKPFPAQGTGYHRLIYVLLKQDGKIDFSSEQRQVPCFSLRERTFKTLDFYRKFEDVLTPAGLNFFQCRWDKSVTDVYREILDMREPIYEYDYPPKYIAPQKKWPHRRRIEYLEKYIPPE